MYVQDVICKNSVEIFDLIMNKNAHLYICGDVQMAVDVTVAIENIFKVEGNIDQDKAKDFIKHLKVFLLLIFFKFSLVRI
jgi:sulfite reductase alpha subunit-like flavoprotein